MCQQSVLAKAQTSSSVFVRVVIMSEDGTKVVKRIGWFDTREEWEKVLEMALTAHIKREHLR